MIYDTWGIVARSKPNTPKFGYSVIEIGLVGNVGKIILPTLSHNFSLAFELILYLRCHIELRNLLGITWQNFFPKKGQTQNPKMYTVCLLLNWTSITKLSWSAMHRDILHLTHDSMMISGSWQQQPGLGHSYGVVFRHAMQLSLLSWG